MADLREYEVTLAEREHPPRREGMRFIVHVWRSGSRAARAGFSDRYIVLAVRLLEVVR